MPQLWLVAGPNGAGKSTLANRQLASRIPVISPDTIAATSGLSPLQAGKAAVRERERLLLNSADFAVDTTFAGGRELDLIRDASARGYKVNLVFVCVRSAGLCQTRILERVARGEHSVPPEDVVRRYARSLQNLTVAFELADRIFLLDNTGKKYRLILSYEGGRIKFRSKNMPAWALGAIPARLLPKMS